MFLFILAFTNIFPVLYKYYSHTYNLFWVITSLFCSRTTQMTYINYVPLKPPIAPFIIFPSISLVLYYTKTTLMHIPEIHQERGKILRRKGIYKTCSIYPPFPPTRITHIGEIYVESESRISLSGKSTPSLACQSREPGRKGHSRPRKHDIIHGSRNEQRNELCGNVRYQTT